MFQNSRQPFLKRVLMKIRHIFGSVAVLSENLRKELLVLALLLGLLAVELALLLLVFRVLLGLGFLSLLLGDLLLVFGFSLRELLLLVVAGLLNLLGLFDLLVSLLHQLAEDAVFVDSDGLSHCKNQSDELHFY